MIDSIKISEPITKTSIEVYRINSGELMIHVNEAHQDNGSEQRIAVSMDKETLRYFGSALIQMSKM